jgi:predicted component of type VI protein secretion system
MTIDTLAYVKTLEAAGLDRQAAEAQAEAIVRHILPDLATKADLEQAIERLERRIDEAVERLEHRIDLAVERTAHQQTVRFFGMTLGIVGVMDAILFALLRVVH